MSLVLTIHLLVFTSYRRGLTNTFHVVFVIFELDL